MDKSECKVSANPVQQCPGNPLLTHWKLKLLLIIYSVAIVTLH